MEIITKNNLIFKVNWCGVSTIDGMLWMEIPDESIVKIANIFGNPCETEKLIYKRNDEDGVTFENYTSLTNMYTNTSGVVFSLKKV